MGRFGSWTSQLGFINSNKNIKPTKDDDKTMR
jgi:hypothetical protein